ncbi:uncharacterized protein LOC132276854 [Cornus florida]|uniref:uncharacterized protein LOC132276854 n=1 Tax=Cornus florida TaxID=4283 RepID=UPI00289B3B3E|nr:uncharacterized protein LOC132276854 [Cornus florida]
MVKLASARQSRIYGPQLARDRSKYMNAGLYVFATIVLLCGSGLVLLLIGLALIIFVNVHDLLAHLAGIDYRLPLMEFDVQLGLVEFAVPMVQITTTLLYFLGILFFFSFRYPLGFLYPISRLISYSVFEKDETRKGLGVCPQNDILFPELIGNSNQMGKKSC